MKFTNPTGRTLTEIQSNLSFHYPNIKTRKAFFNAFGPQHLLVPSGAVKHVIRPTKNNTVLVTDFIPPVFITLAALLVSIIVVSLILTLLLKVPVFGGAGGLGFILIFLLIKAIYKSANKEKFEKFHTDLELALTSSNQPGSIF
ncbi:hypothetical protein LL912_09910 [Niabella sp. CC-SYL272]|uniref:hypothetical protein n=1 Tax=Niabella agricola TaxID=2891571 RepID=UPI001F1CCF13|nr:hypothetical protein [Niabella agricola]MCF3109091.1 hypothetical protein [Niabella agricola]